MRDVARFETEPAWPEWLDVAWLEQAPLVVRREDAGGRIPVGARGKQRNQRCKGYVAPVAVARCVTPEMLARQVRPELAQSELAPLRVLATLAQRLDAIQLAWGPAGGVGFFLASGLPVLRPDSDLDLLVRAPEPLETAAVCALASMQAGRECRVDIQVDTGRGGFALSEYARGRGRVLLKTDSGPVLLDDPWAFEEAA